ncbi:Conserved membrane protein YqgC [Fictibacillus macauensis ZFHKF-1]|uniref:Conserved membrane protein YqgC n=1 Tax=Fictibacillus macauensis ZFHKF-1 TaxID=1196324 RepID=I8J0B1_9BACL|nr:DUF456 family protein [Fictibacillus macauensis]EIT85181.1 Conserved membrane protein YqgC [Fictibacillus macauensis ZFHKF-1]
MDLLYSVTIGLCFVLSFVAFVYPILPGALFLVLGFVLYGWIYSFHVFTPTLLIIEGISLISLFLVDYASNLYGIKKFGGSKAAAWGSTLGLLIGPFVIPGIGLIIGPFAGAVIGQLITGKQSVGQAIKVGIGSVLGFLGGTVVKALLHVFMIGIFLFYIF